MKTAFFRFSGLYLTRMNLGDRVEVQIEKMTLHGTGLARHAGMVLFVEYVAPGDRLLVEVTGLEKNFAYAKIVQILEESKERKKAPCPVFGSCGGCDWQHLSEESQRHWKQVLVQENLERFWGSPIPFLPFVQSPEDFRYRNRIQLKKNGSEVGYYGKGSHRLVPVDDCLLAEEALVQKIPELKKSPSKQSENWELSIGAKGDVSIHAMDDRDLGFSQVNRFVNDLLLKTVLQWAGESEWTSFFDFYAGSGNFTFPLAEKFPSRSGVGVELSSTSVEKARKEINLRNWSPKRLEFFRSDVGFFLRRQSPPENSFVLLDPPRSGLEKDVVAALAQSEAKTLLIISCDPMSLGRDLKRLKEASTKSWSVVRAQCFDMFPQTHHVETLIELRIDTPASNVSL